MDFIGEINPSSLGKHKWILTTIDFFTKWVEAIPTRNATDKVIISFIQENILSRFGCPKNLLTDNDNSFKSKAMVAFCEENGIVLKHSTPYYPRGNVLAESTNKSIIQSIKKLLSQNKRSWDSMLKYALWADKITIKKAIGTYPFQLVYGTDVVFPVQLGIPVMKFLQDSQEEPSDIQRRVYALIELQQNRESVEEKAQLYRNKIK